MANHSPAHFNGDSEDVKRHATEPLLIVVRVVPVSGCNGKKERKLQVDTSKPSILHSLASKGRATVDGRTLAPKSPWNVDSPANTNHGVPWFPRAGFRSQL